MEQEKTRSGFAALIGRPNVGKSTLMNHIIGQKIAITSRKPQTTRNRIQTVYTDERGQIIFQDTPGIHKAKNKLGYFMVNTAESTPRDVDVCLWLVEPSEKIGPGDRHIAKLLEKSGVPVILVINKIDRVKKTELEAVIAGFKSLMHFDDIIAVSALLSRNLDAVTDAVFRFLPYGPLYYDPDTVTDQSERQIVSELIREKALRGLGDEIPHGIAVLVERMKERPDGRIVDIDADIVCEKDSHKGIIIGKNGAKLKEIGSQARPEIEQLLDKKVNLKLWVKVRKDWRDSDVQVRNFGYDNG